MLRSELYDILSFSQEQIAFLGPLECKIFFGLKSKVVNYEKLIQRIAIRFFVLMDTILLNWGLRKRPNVSRNSSS